MASDKIQRNIQLMVLKWFFDRLVSLIGLLVVWPVLLIVAIMIKVKMPGGPAIFTQKRMVFMSMNRERLMRRPPFSHMPRQF